MVEYYRDVAVGGSSPSYTPMLIDNQKLRINWFPRKVYKYVNDIYGDLLTPFMSKKVHLGDWFVAEEKPQPTYSQGKTFFDKGFIHCFTTLNAARDFSWNYGTVVEAWIPPLVRVGLDPQTKQICAHRIYITKKVHKLQ